MRSKYCSLTRFGHTPHCIRKNSLNEQKKQPYAVTYIIMWTFVEAMPLQSSLFRGKGPWRRKAVRNTKNPHRNALQWCAVHLLQNEPASTVPLHIPRHVYVAGHFEKVVPDKAHEVKPKVQDIYDDKVTNETATPRL